MANEKANDLVKVRLRERSWVNYKYEAKGAVVELPASVAEFFGELVNAPKASEPKPEKKDK